MKEPSRDVDGRLFGLEYDKERAIREWNAGFRVPPVCTAFWTKADWDKWEESRKPLPPYDEWLKKKLEGS